MFCMKKMYFLHEKTTQPPKKPKFCMKKLHKNDKKGTKKSIQPPKIRSFVWKKLSFFTLKHLPASQKTEIVHEKMTKNWQKRAPTPAKTWSFAWKNCLFLLKNTTQPRKKLKFCMKKWQKIDKKGTKKSIQPRKNWVLH